MPWVNESLEAPKEYMRLKRLYKEALKGQGPQNARKVVYLAILLIQLRNSYTKVLGLSLKFLK